jgi:hypothetical protein
MDAPRYHTHCPMLHKQPWTTVVSYRDRVRALFIFIKIA